MTDDAFKPRRRPNRPPIDSEPVRVVTVRMPARLHEALRTLNTTDSMNTVCVSAIRTEIAKRRLGVK